MNVPLIAPVVLWIARARQWLRLFIYSLNHLSEKLQLYKEYI